MEIGGKISPRGLNKRWYRDAKHRVDKNVSKRSYDNDVTLLQAI